MIEYSRGDVEFLAMELFQTEHGNRSWWTFEDKNRYRLRAQVLLDTSLIGTLQVIDVPKVVVKRGPNKPREKKYK